MEGEAKEMSLLPGFEFCREYVCWQLTTEMCSRVMKRIATAAEMEYWRTVN